MIIQKQLHRLMIFPIIMCVLLLGMQISQASRQNPFSSVEILDISGAEEAAYIDKKTTDFFNAYSRPSDNYVVPDGWQREILSFDDVQVEKYTSTKTDTDRILLFLHGGGYVGGLNNNYRDWGLHKAELAGNATLLALDYRLAPQHLYPAALEDAVKAYKGLLQAGYNPENMILMGDSAGGNLAAVLSVYLRDNNIPQPKAIILISPWTYLDGNLPSHLNNFQKDKILGYKNKRLTKEIIEPTYAKGANVTDPYLSPSFANLTGISPILITAGGDEMLLDDTILFAAHAKADGVNITEKIYPGMSHDWTLILPELPETKAMNDDIVQFINAHLK